MDNGTSLREWGGGAAETMREPQVKVTQLGGEVLNIRPVYSKGAIGDLDGRPEEPGWYFDYRVMRFGPYESRAAAELSIGLLGRCQN